MRFYLIAFFSLLIGLAPAAEENPAAPDGKPLPGHSTHGEAFNEGPRRQAVLIGADKVGGIRFPVTTKSAEAQAFFNQGVGQLHGFWYFEGERSFRQVALLDPGCAMAYWGLAMANINNPERAKEFIRNAGKLKPKASPLEQAWIHALSDALPKTFAQLKAREAAPFPIVADPHLKVFKTYHCYDEFENMPLHGTFLIDGSVLVRWQDIGFEPFRDAKWLFVEAKRLLTLANTPLPR